MKKITVLLVSMISIYSYGQVERVCNNKKFDFDLNSISVAKCSVVLSSEEEDLEVIEPEVVTIIQSKKKKTTYNRRRRVVSKKRKAVTGLNNSNFNTKTQTIKTETKLIGELVGENYERDVLPFDSLEDKPVFDSCVDISLLDQTKCFNNQLINHISNNFRYPKSSFAKGIQGKVVVSFVISKKGEVKNLVLKGPYKGIELEQEAERIISILPRFKTAGKIGGRSVNTKINVPIRFKIIGRAPTNVLELNNREDVVDDVYDLTLLDNIPQFQNCRNSKKDEAVTCFNKEVIRHIKENFLYPEEAKRRGIKGRVFVLFVVDKKGDVVNIRTKGPKDGHLLEEEARRIFYSLPKLVPGTLNGKVVNTKYVFPLTFEN